MNEEQEQRAREETITPQVSAVPARISEVLPDKLLVLPLRARPFFPAQTMPIVGWASMRSTICSMQWGKSQSSASTHLT